MFLWVFLYDSAGLSGLLHLQHMTHPVPSPSSDLRSHAGYFLFFFLLSITFSVPSPSRCFADTFFQTLTLSSQIPCFFLHVSAPYNSADPILLTCTRPLFAVNTLFNFHVRLRYDVYIQKHGCHQEQKFYGNIWPFYGLLSIVLFL